MNSGDSAKIDALLLSLAQRLIRSANDGYANLPVSSVWAARKLSGMTYMVHCDSPSGRITISTRRTVVRFPTERLQIPNYEFNDDAPEPNTVDTKGHLYQADKKRRWSSPCKRCWRENERDSKRYIFHYIFSKKPPHNFFSKKRFFWGGGLYKGKPPKNKSFAWF